MADVELADVELAPADEVEGAVVAGGAGELVTVGADSLTGCAATVLVVAPKEEEEEEVVVGCGEPSAVPDSELEPVPEPDGAVVGGEVTVGDEAVPDPLVPPALVGADGEHAATNCPAQGPFVQVSGMT